MEILQALNKANKALAELKGMAHQLPNQGMLINSLALREAKASTETIYLNIDLFNLLAEM